MAAIANRRTGELNLNDESLITHKCKNCGRMFEICIACEGTHCPKCFDCSDIAEQKMDEMMAEPTASEFELSERI